MASSIVWLGGSRRKTGGYQHGVSLVSRGPGRYPSRCWIVTCVRARILPAASGTPPAAIPAMHHRDADARRELTATIRGDREELLREGTEDDHVRLPGHAHTVRANR